MTKLEKENRDSQRPAPSLRPHFTATTSEVVNLKQAYELAKNSPGTIVTDCRSTAEKSSA